MSDVTDATGADQGRPLTQLGAVVASKGAEENRRSCPVASVTSVASAPGVTGVTVKTKPRSSKPLST